MIDIFKLSESKNIIVILLIHLLLLSLTGCKKQKPLIVDFPINSLNRVMSKYNLKMDNEISYDGLGSIRVESEDTTTAYLFVLRDIPVKRAKIVWEAYCKSKDLKGEAFLEMGVQIQRNHGKDIETFLNRSEDDISGTTDWQKIEVEFMVLDNKVNVVQLNLIIEGVGTIWIDQVRFTATPIK